MKPVESSRQATVLLCATCEYHFLFWTKPSSATPERQKHKFNAEWNLISVVRMFLPSLFLPELLSIADMREAKTELTYVTFHLKIPFSYIDLTSQKSRSEVLRGRGKNMQGKKIHRPKIWWTGLRLHPTTQIIVIKLSEASRIIASIEGIPLCII